MEYVTSVECDYLMNIPLSTDTLQLPTAVGSCNPIPGIWPMQNQFLDFEISSAYGLVFHFDDQIREYAATPVNAYVRVDGGKGKAVSLQLGGRDATTFDSCYEAGWLIRAIQHDSL
jgi:hypothetical protein